MFEVPLQPMSLNPLGDVVGPERWSALVETGKTTTAALDGSPVWHINSTAQGGGVAEMLQTLLAYCQHAGMDTRWLVVEGEPTFFATTKRIHNVLHGEPGDGGELGDAERKNYEEVAERNLAAVIDRINPGDVVFLHDPQTAGMLPGLKAKGARVVWRSHIGRDEPNEHTDRGWNFLAPYIEQAEVVIVSRPNYAPPGIPQDKIVVIAPSIDPFATKNATLPDTEAQAVLIRAGLLAGADCGLDLGFNRRDKSRGRVRSHSSELMAAGGPVPPGARIVTQVSRWDRLKDMPGVMTGFIDHLHADDAHLVLAGPAVAEVSDDPEGGEVLAECLALWRELPHSKQQRVHLATVPMDDVEENAHIINALQTHSAIVVQKSLREGFGLTVTEAMWKGRPVVASRVGGIQDQIVDHRDGLLLDDPSDFKELGTALQRILDNPDVAAGLGACARERVRSDFLGDRHLTQYCQVLRDLKEG